MSNELSRIINSKELATFVKMDEFTSFVNQDPPAQYVKDHPLAKGVRYIPIDKIELMLDKIFQQWYVEVLDSGQLLNAVTVTIRLFYRHPVSKEWLHQDGLGAVAIQVEKGENASNLASVKSNAIMLGLPSAKSYAIKDATDHIGKVFGRDLNRKDTMAFTASYGTQDVKEKIETQKAILRDRLAKARKAKEMKKHENN